VVTVWPERPFTRLMPSLGQSSPNGP
jgi:hypothetical protein